MGTLVEIRCVQVVGGRSCGHTVMQHALPEQAFCGSYDTADPQPCTCCSCEDFRALA